MATVKQQVTPGASGRAPVQDRFSGFSSWYARMRERNRSGFMPNKAAAPFGP